MNNNENVLNRQKPGKGHRCRTPRNLTIGVEGRTDRRVSVQRCKPCAKLHDHADMPKYLSTGLTQYVLNNVSKSPPPHHVTQNDVSIPLQVLEVEKITGHQSVRGQGGVIAVLYKKQWSGRSRPSWEREIDLQLFRHEILRYWAGTPNQHRQTNRLHGRMRIDAAQRELSRSNSERFLAPGYGYVPREEWLSRYLVHHYGASQRSPLLVQGR